MRRALTLLPLAAAITVLLEIVVFTAVSRRLGFAVALLLVLLTSLVGVELVRREGARAWRRFRAALHTGAPPGPQVTDGLVGMAAGLLLAVPGLVTSLAGAVLALPPGRRIARDALQRAAQQRMTAVGMWQWGGAPRRGPHPDHDTVIEGEVIDPNGQ